MPDEKPEKQMGFVAHVIAVSVVAVPLVIVQGAVVSYQWGIMQARMDQSIKERAANTATNAEQGVRITVLETKLTNISETLRDISKKIDVAIDRRP